jgi:5-(carboxyamino)imidazole ribonucleotide synthase
VNFPVLNGPSAVDGEVEAALSIGVLGGGQLALMMAREAEKLGLALHLQTPNPNDPATRLASSVVLADLNDARATRDLAGRAARIGFENEWVSIADLERLEQEGITFLPPLSALAPLLDKRSQRQLLNQLHLPTPHWVGMEACLPPAPALSGQAEGEVYAPLSSTFHTSSLGLAPAMEQAAPQGPRLPDGLAFPVIAKASRGGYDGKGTRLLANLEQLENHLETHDPEAWILEELVLFEMELAQVVCRDGTGAVRCFPLVQTHQRNQVCDWVLYPAPVSHAVEAFARNVAMSLVTSLNYVGVMGIEFFYGPGGLLVNEIAPRVHNSGHLTLEACATNQFAQQVRILAGLPMGPTDPSVNGALMINLLGYADPDTPDAQANHLAQRQALEAMPGAHLHWYGKSSRKGRKLGHITFVLDAKDSRQLEGERERRLSAVRAIWPWAEPTAP